LSSQIKEKNNDHEELFALMEKMLTYDPAARIIVKDALDHPFFYKIPASQRVDWTTMND